MAEYTQRTLLRSANGPTIVDTSYGSPKTSSTRRSHHRDDKDGRDKQHSNHHHHHATSKRPPPPSSNPPRQDSSPDRKDRRKRSHRREDNGVKPLATMPDPLNFVMDIIEPPPRSIALGTAIDTSAMISILLPSPDTQPASSTIDTSRLLAVASLVADTRSGDRIPIEAGNLTGQKMFDSIHAIPAECASPLARSHPCRLALGYFSFPALLIRQAGSYRVRVTLIKMGGPGTSSGASSLVAVDSDPIRVERRVLHPGRAR
ncbi:hypothetical protein MBLNU230_g6973t1 [Neophaeotheca triangularis]